MPKRPPPSLEALRHAMREKMTEGTPSWRFHPKLAETIKNVHAGPLKTWDGEFHLHMPGKTGELFFATGILPALRAALPACKVIIHTVRHYLPVLKGAAHKPDSVAFYDSYAQLGFTEDMPLLTKGLLALRCVKITKFQNEGSTQIHTSLYRTHDYYFDDPECTSNDTPFYQFFMDAVGLSGAPYSPPRWHAPPELIQQVNAKRGSDRPVALVLSSANAHATGWRVMPVTEPQWQSLAERVSALGFQPLMTAHSADPRQSTPGWDWFESDDLGEVLTLLSLCHRVVGMNSGLVFSATQIAQGRVTMFNPRPDPMYFFDSMIADKVINPEVHTQIPIEDSTPAYSLVEKALM